MDGEAVGAAAWKASPRGVLIALLAIHVLAHIDRNMLLGFSPQITRDLALSNAQYGLLAGAAWVLSFGVMAVLMGALADRFSRTRVMAAGILIWSVCTGASGAAQSFQQMLAARFLVASGEAALVPAAVSLIAELFGAERRSTAAGVFFTGIPLGIGASFLLAGTLGASHGWRGTFALLGVIGAVIALPLLLLEDRRGSAGVAQRGPAFGEQLRSVLEQLRAKRSLIFVITGFVLVQFVFVGLSFTQLWLVRERGVDSAHIAREIGALQLVFGLLGSVVGGVLSDRLARRIKGGHAAFMALLVICCVPLMLAYRLGPSGSILFYAGMCAGFFLPLATYGPALALIQALTPGRLHATITGSTMMLVNVFAIAIGNLGIGALSDKLAAHGSAHPLTLALLATDLLALASASFFVLAARGHAQTAGS